MLNTRRYTQWLKIWKLSAGSPNQRGRNEQENGTCPHYPDHHPGSLHDADRARADRDTYGPAAYGYHAALRDDAPHGGAHGDTHALVSRCAGIEGYRLFGLHPGGGWLPEGFEIPWDLLVKKDRVVFILNLEDGTKTEVPHFNETAPEGHFKFADALLCFS